MEFAEIILKIIVSFFLLIGSAVVGMAGILFAIYLLYKPKYKISGGKDNVAKSKSVKQCVRQVWMDD